MLQPVQPDDMHEVDTSSRVTKSIQPHFQIHVPRPLTKVEEGGVWMPADLNLPRGGRSAAMAQRELPCLGHLPEGGPRQYRTGASNALPASP